MHWRGRRPQTPEWLSCLSLRRRERAERFCLRSHLVRVFYVYRVASFLWLRFSLFVAGRVRKTDDAETLCRGGVIAIIEMGILFVKQAVKHCWRESIMSF